MLHASTERGHTIMQTTTRRPATDEVLEGTETAFNVPPEVAYFNTANLAPQLHSVRAAGEAALERRARPWTISADDWFSDTEALRSLFGALIGADAEGIAVVPATSYGFAVAAQNLRLGPRQRVLVLAEEYPSGVYTWRSTARRAGAEILTVSRERGQGWTEAVLEALDDRVAIVSVPNVHWTDGALVDLTAVAARAREVGARLMIDGSQSIGALPLDVATIRPDFVVAVGYKWLLGPFNLGYMYVAEEHRDGRPLEENWILRAGSEDFARLVDYRDEYQPGARRFDVGQRSKFELTPMAIAALGQLVQWRVPRVAATLSVMTGLVARHARELGLEPLPDELRGPHMLGIRLPREVRDRTLPALAAAGCFAAVRGESLRISPHLHVTDAHIERLLGALTDAVGQSPNKAPIDGSRPEQITSPGTARAAHSERANNRERDDS
jgi:selenocysteine lyase/cysteine desulfurase